VMPSACEVCADCAWLSARTPSEAEAVTITAHRIGRANAVTCTMDVLDPCFTSDLLGEIIAHRTSRMVCYLSARLHRRLIDHAFQPPVFVPRNPRGRASVQHHTCGNASSCGLGFRPW